MHFSTSPPALILWSYIKLNHKKSWKITHACKNRERVRAATAADTIIAARMFSSPMFSASPATNCRASSPSIWTEVQWLGALQYSWTSYNTRRKLVLINTGSSIYLNCFIYAGLKTHLLQTFKTKSTEAR